MLFRDRRHLLTKACRVIACDGNATNVYDRRWWIPSRRLSGGGSRDAAVPQQGCTSACGDPFYRLLTLPVK